MLWVFVLDNGKVSLKRKNKLKLIPNKFIIEKISE